jgi:hypothetical protein
MKNEREPFKRACEQINPNIELKSNLCWLLENFTLLIKPIDRVDLMAVQPVVARHQLAKKTFWAQ